MSTEPSTELRQYCLELAKRARAAAVPLANVTGQQKNDWLRRSAAALRQQTDAILQANAQDIQAAPDFGLTSAQVDRLKLSPERIEGIATGLEEVAQLPDPIGEMVDFVVRPNGLRIGRIRVPLGVVFFIYESRPNVTADAAAICVKSGNAVILRGGKEAAHSSQAIVQIVSDLAEPCGIPPYAVQLVETRDRAAVGHLLSMSQYIDVAIPRGGEGLIRRVTEEATMPVIKHFDGNCHVYVDRDADLAMAENITINSKCQRMGVCNAAESLVVHEQIASTFLPQVAKSLAQQGVEIRGDQRTRDYVSSAKPATEEDFGTEYLGPIISVKVVSSLDEAIEHINRFGSGHTDAIVTENLTRRAGIHKPRRQCRGDGQRQHTISRRRRVRAGGGDRHQHRPVPRTGAVRAARADQLQVCRRGHRTDSLIGRTGQGLPRQEFQGGIAMSHAELTPEEEALLAAELTEEENQATGTDSEAASAYDASEVTRQLEAVESFHQDLACRFEDVLSNALQRIVETRLVEVESMTYSQFAFSRDTPTCFVLIQATPLPASLALDFAPSIFYPILDCLLGGGKRPCSIPDRPPTELEARLATRIAQRLLDELHDLWERVLAVNLTVDRIESHAHRVRLVAPRERVITLAFETQVAEQTGRFTLCLPLQAIRKIVDKLLAGDLRAKAAIAQGNEPSGKAVELTVQVDLPHVTTSDLERLQVGDVLRTTVESDGAIDVLLDGKPAFEGRLGAVNGRRAIELLRPTSEE